uniref:Uncharacterized protein n=1 Tax=Octactis speculum TaxID=3111310 RepID=A0A7S2FYF1_9STRA|mmetsp:Transcript_33914/g.45829  ORF Transcript_33914/g.45829 Transcript_33914/m.45829 type:complete len:102 (+) Transcript_33914:122-427(+)
MPQSSATTGRTWTQRGKNIKFSNTDWISAAQNKFRHEQSSCASITGIPFRDRPANLTHDERYVNGFGNIKKTPGLRTVMDNNLQDLLSRKPRQVDITRDGG